MLYAEGHRSSKGAGGCKIPPVINMARTKGSKNKPLIIKDIEPDDPMDFVCEKDPKAYEWLPHECNRDGIPHVQIAPVTLEKDKERQKFYTQEDVDMAWANGWHDDNRPETAYSIARKRSLKINDNNG